MSVPIIQAWSCPAHFRSRQPEMKELSSIFGGTKPSPGPWKETNMLIQGKKKKAGWGKDDSGLFLALPRERNAIFHFLSLFLFLVFPCPPFLWVSEELGTAMRVSAWLWCVPGEQGRHVATQAWVAKVTSGHEKSYSRLFYLPRYLRWQSWLPLHFIQAHRGSAYSWESKNMGKVQIQSLRGKRGSLERLYPTRRSFRAQDAMGHSSRCHRM